MTLPSPDQSLSASTLDTQENTSSAPSGRIVPDVPPPVHDNCTPFPAQYFQMVDRNAEVFHVIVLRLTFDMSALDTGDQVMNYAAEQTPLCTEDAWIGEPNQSPPLWESDFAPYKPKCDIIVVNANSTPPKGKKSEQTHIAKARRWLCGVSLIASDNTPTWKKMLAVTGPRRLGFFGVSSPELAAGVDIHYGNAYGGERKSPLVDLLAKDGKTITKKAGSDAWDTDERNPIGVGYGHSFIRYQPEDKRAPQLETSLYKPFKGGRRQRHYPPVSLTAIGRAWLPRRQLAGTYDEDWRKEQWPLPPLDHDYSYWQCAPEDQQIAYPASGSRLTLVNLYPGQEIWTGRLPLHLPCIRLKKTNDPQEGSDELMNLDTIIINPRDKQVVAVFRATVFAEEGVQTIETHMMQIFSKDSSVAEDDIERHGGIKLRN